MRKMILILFILNLHSFKIKAGPLEVAQNIFNEYRQVIELINQLDELKKQLEAKVEMIKNLSGAKEYIVSELEQKLRNWHPHGDDLLDPPPSSDTESYSYTFEEIEESLDLYDLVEVYGLTDENDTQNQNYTSYIAGNNYQRVTIASAAYGKTILEQSTDRNTVINDYIQLVGDAESIKETTDIQTQILAQATYNQIEINKSMAMLLQLKSAQGQKQLAQIRWYHNLLRKREQ